MWIRRSIRFLLLLAAVTVTIRYVDGQMLSFPAARWSHVRGDSVDWVRACNPKCTVFSSDSVYWMYREGKNWVIGGGPAGYGKIKPEIVLRPDGTQRARWIKFMPDLHLRQVKLGWWWPGTKNHPQAERPK